MRLSRGSQNANMLAYDDFNCRKRERDGVRLFAYLKNNCTMRFAMWAERSSHRAAAATAHSSCLSGERAQNSFSLFVLLPHSHLVSRSYFPLFSFFLSVLRWDSSLSPLLPRMVIEKGRICRGGPTEVVDAVDSTGKL